MFDVRRAWEEIISNVMADAVFFGEAHDVARLRDWVATEVDNACRRRFEECVDDIFVQPSARWVNDDRGVTADMVEGVFAGCQDCCRPCFFPVH